MTGHRTFRVMAVVVRYIIRVQDAFQWLYDLQVAVGNLISVCYSHFSIIKQKETIPTRITNYNIINIPLLIKMRYLLRNRDIQFPHLRNHFWISFLTIKISKGRIEK